MSVAPIQSLISQKNDIELELGAIVDSLESEAYMNLGMDKALVMKIRNFVWKILENDS